MDNDINMQIKKAKSKVLLSGESEITTISGQPNAAICVKIEDKNQAYLLDLSNIDSIKSHKIISDVQKVESFNLFKHLEPENEGERI